MKPISWNYLLFALFSGLIVGISFFIATKFYYYSIHLETSATKIRERRADLEAEERDLRLSFEFTKSSVERYKFSKILFASPAQIRRLASEGKKLDWKQFNPDDSKYIDQLNALDKQITEVKKNSESLYWELASNEMIAEEYQTYSKVLLIFSLLIIVIGVIYLLFKANNVKAFSLKQSTFYRFSQITNFFFSRKNQKEIFEPIIADWQEEYFEALGKKEIWKARWINIRYSYAFLIAMWQKSPIGDLIEFISKIAK